MLPLKHFLLLLLFQIASLEIPEALPEGLHPELPYMDIMMDKALWEVCVRKEKTQSYDFFGAMGECLEAQSDIVILQKVIYQFFLNCACKHPLCFFSVLFKLLTNQGCVPKVIKVDMLMRVEWSMKQEGPWAVREYQMELKGILRAAIERETRSILLLIFKFRMFRLQTKHSFSLQNK